eukprot:g6453.t1
MGMVARVGLEAISNKFSYDEMKNPCLSILACKEPTYELRFDTCAATITSEWCHIWKCNQLKWEYFKCSNALREILYEDDCKTEREVREFEQLEPDRDKVPCISKEGIDCGLRVPKIAFGNKNKIENCNRTSKNFNVDCTFKATVNTNTAVLALKMGSGKTFSIAEYIRDNNPESILIVVYRKSLRDGILNDLIAEGIYNIVDYETKKDDDYYLYENKIIIQLDSLFRIKPFAGRWTFKVDHFSASGISEPDEETIEWILRTCFKEKKRGKQRSIDVATDYATGLAERFYEPEDLYDRIEGTAPALEDLIFIFKAKKHLILVVQALHNVFEDMEEYEEFINKNCDTKRKTRAVIDTTDTADIINYMDARFNQITNQINDAVVQIKLEFKGLHSEIDGLFNLNISLSSSMFPRWVLLVPDPNIGEDESLDKGMESTKGFFGKLNHSIFGMIKEFGAAKRKAFEKMKIFNYWRLFIIDEGPNLNGFQNLKSNLAPIPFAHAGLRIETPGKNLIAAVPLSKFLVALANIAGLFSPAIGMNIWPIGDTMLGSIAKDANKLTELKNMYESWYTPAKQEENQLNAFIRDVHGRVEQAKVNLNNKHAYKEQIDLNLNKIEGFENIKEALGTARETIARVVEAAYPTWEKELDRVGLRKIFDKHGNCFWVSQWYYDNCEKIIDPDTSKPMYKTQSGYNVEGQGESAAGSAMNAVRARTPHNKNR